MREPIRGSLIKYADIVGILKISEGFFIPHIAKKDKIC